MIMCKISMWSNLDMCNDLTKLQKLCVLLLFEYHETRCDKKVMTKLNVRV